MSNFITVLMISTIVGLPQSFDPQPQIMQQRDPEQIQSSDISPKRGDGRREN